MTYEFIEIDPQVPQGVLELWHGIMKKNDVHAISVAYPDGTSADGAYVIALSEFCDAVSRIMTSQPKLVLALPDYEKRKLVVASDEVIDGERLVCLAIKGDGTQ